MSARESIGRVRWADTAKGACIILVVLWHVTRKDYLQLDWDLSAPVVGAWGQLSVLLLPVRMPLFFFVSGLFAVRLLDRPWREVLTRRVAPLLYLFVLWTLVHTVLFRLTPGFDTEVADGPLDLVAGLTVTPGNLWYLLALAVYVAVARLTRAHPDAALAGAFALASAAAVLAPYLPGNGYGVLANLLLFLLGVRHPTFPRPLLLTGMFLVAVVAVPELRPVVGLLGVVAGVTAAKALVGLPWLASVGQRTLPVYVLHLPLVALLHLVSPHLGGSLVLAVGYPVVATALVVATCLALHRVLPGWLFTAPWLGARRRLLV